MTPPLGDLRDCLMGRAYKVASKKKTYRLLPEGRLTDCLKERAYGLPHEEGLQIASRRKAYRLPQGEGLRIASRQESKALADDVTSSGEGDNLVIRIHSGVIEHIIRHMREQDKRIAWLEERLDIMMSFIAPTPLPTAVPLPTTALFPQRHQLHDFGQTPASVRRQSPIRVLRNRAHAISSNKKEKFIIRVEAEEIEQPRPPPPRRHQTQGPSHIEQPRCFRTLEEKKIRDYPFRRDVVGKIFRSLSRRSSAFQLPQPTRPDQMEMSSEPNFCPYHRRLGHTIEDCFNFKGWLEERFRSGALMIPDEYLADA